MNRQFACPLPTRRLVKFKPVAGDDGEFATAGRESKIVNFGTIGERGNTLDFRQAIHAQRRCPAVSYAEPMAIRRDLPPAGTLRGTADVLHIGVPQRYETDA